MTATLPQIACAMSCAERGCSAISSSIFAARRSCISKRSSISAAWSSNSSPWPGSTVSTGSRRVCAQRLQVHDQRARAAAAGLAGAPAERLRDQRVRGDVLDQVVAGEQHPALARRRTPCPTASGPGRCRTCSVRSANVSSPPSVSGVRDRRAAAPAAERARHRGQRGDHVARDPVAQHQRLRELVVVVGVDVEVLDHRGEQVERADLGAGAVGDDPDEPEVVGVLVGDDDPLEVLEPRARARAARPRARPATRAEFGPTSTSVSGSSSIR